MPSHETFDFGLLERQLQQVRAGVGAAEAHGIICGVLCCPETARTAWLAEILTGTDAEHAPPARCTQMLEQVFLSTRQQLGSLEYEFYPLLPDDNQSLDLRSVALGNWCSGFLYGLHLGGPIDLKKLPEHSREIVTDFSAFTELRGDGKTEESEESAYAELVEYIRVGVMLVNEQLSGAERVAPDCKLH